MYIRRRIKNAIRHLFRSKLLRQYPFLEIIDPYTGQATGYNWFDDIPQGWHVLIPCLLEDITAAAIADNVNIKDCVHFTQIKEKYGSLRLYAAATNSVLKVLSIYEHLAELFCINCGKPHVCFTKGYIIPLCKECWHWNDALGKFVSEKQKFDYVATRFTNSGTYEEHIDIKPYYDRIIASMNKK